MDTGFSIGMHSPPSWLKHLAQVSHRRQAECRPLVSEEHGAEVVLALGTCADKSRRRRRSVSVRRSGRERGDHVPRRLSGVSHPRDLVASFEYVLLPGGLGVTMKTTTLVVALAVAMLLQIGCHRTRYINLAPPDAISTAPEQSLPRRRTRSGWQHFFVYGWAPGVKVIDGEEICGGPHRVREIRTQRTFVQGLVGAVAGYYVNIYNPYDGRVVCLEEPVR